MLIFQYGSNVLDSQLNGEHRLKGDAKFISLAQTLEGYVLDFVVYSERRKCAASSLIRKAGEQAWGALYEVPEFLVTRIAAQKVGRLSLDAIEGEGGNYVRGSIRVRQSDGSITTAITYMAKNPRDDVRTNAEYVSYIIDGLRERGAPEEYITKIWNKAVENNPELAV